jgi:ADP-ribose pyrophosphatase YjhB (NUDIX family)
MTNPDLVPDHLLGRVCTGNGVGAAILGAGQFPELGDFDDRTPRFLMCLRGNLRTEPDGPGVRNDPDRWDFPGGGVNFGEKLKRAVRREIREELGAQLVRVESLGAIEHTIRGADGQIQEHWISHTHLARIKPGSPPPLVPEAERTKLVRLRFLAISDIRLLPLASSMAPNLALIERLRPELVA